MISRKALLCGGSSVVMALSLAGCGGSGSSSTTPSQSLSITSYPTTLAYLTPETFSVTLAVTPTPTGGLGFSDLTLHLTPSTSAALLTTLPATTCTAITASSTSTTCTFVVENESSPNATITLDEASYYVTGSFQGQTITSNTVTPTYTPPPPTTPYWKITINNVASTNKYLFVMGQDLAATGQPYGVVTFDSHHYGTFHTYSSSTAYGSDNDTLILVPGDNTIYIPYDVWSGRAYISTEQLVGLDLTSDGGIVLPDPGNMDDTNYYTIYDDFEFTYAEDLNTGDSSAVINQTAVDYVSTPICLQASSTNYQPIQQAGFCDVNNRDALLNPIVTALQNADTTLGSGHQWQSLILYNGPSTILRIMSPGSSDALAPPTSQILSFADYLNPYISALATQYSAADSLKVQSPDEAQNLSGNIQNIDGTYTYVFTNSGSGGNGSMPLTSANLLVGAPPAGANAGVTAAYQMISAAFMAGQLPPTASLPADGITESYLRDHTDTFYTQPTFSPPLSADLVQYSVYSKALNTVEPTNIYTYAYDDVLGKSSTMTESLPNASTAPDPVTVTISYE